MKAVRRAPAEYIPIKKVEIICTIQDTDKVFFQHFQKNTLEVYMPNDVESVVMSKEDAVELAKLLLEWAENSEKY